MKRPALTETVSTKLSASDRDRMVDMMAESGYTSRSDWLRDAAVAALNGGDSERVDVRLEELNALRTVMRLLIRLLNGQTVTREEMKLIVEQSDAAKSELARARLSA